MSNSRNDCRRQDPVRNCLLLDARSVRLEAKLTREAEETNGVRYNRILAKLSVF